MVIERNEVIGIINDKSVKVHLVRAFSRDGKGGNPAGVVTDAAEINDGDMQNIAKKVGFSETAFLTRVDDRKLYVRFFTPLEEVDFCGHATLGLFSSLVNLGSIEVGSYTLIAKAGEFEVVVSHQEAAISQLPPAFYKGPSAYEVSLSLGIRERDVAIEDFPIEVVSTGLPDIIIPVKRGCLENIKPNFEHISLISKDYNAIGFHVFEMSSEPLITAHCRNFAPLYGIDEEPATGSASGALACYLSKRFFGNGRHFVFEQGLAMGASSIIKAEVEFDGKDFHRVIVSGESVTLGVERVCF